MYLGSFGIDDYVGIPAATHRFSSGAAYAPTVLTYSIYEEATDVGIDENVDMTVASPFDSITGCYWVRRQLTAAAGFEAGKNYLVVVKATVDSVSAIQMHTFQVRPQQTGDAFARLGAPTGASIAADIAARASQASLDIVDDYIDTEVAGIKVKTDNLPATPAATGDAMTLTAAERASIVDRILGRSIQGGADGNRTVSDALRQLRNRVVIAAGVLTVYQEDDVTPAWTAPVTTNAAAEPIVEINPT